MKNPAIAEGRSAQYEAARPLTRLASLAPALVVGGLTLLFALVNWLWLRANVVTYGWDRMDHLVSSLSYNDILRTVSVKTLFEALAWSDYYPPLFHLGAVVGYKLFGVNEDVAAMTNIVYVALLLGATWSVGRRLGGSAVAALATVMLATFPMIYVMSRYLYIDFALTALVATSLALLLASERFDRRAPALLFGLALGAAFLVKWTAAAFLAAPLLLILGRSGVVGAALRHPAALRPDGRRLALALVGGSALAALWVLPARAVAQAQPLGLWLLPLFALLVAGVLYALLSPPNPRHPRLANVLGAGAVAALTLSLWYLPNINFLEGFYVNAYGKPSGRSWAYDKYLTYIVTEQLSPLYTLLFVLAAVGLLALWLRRQGPRQLRALDDTRLVLLLWALVPFLLFASYVSTAHSRYLMPFLPPLALWMALWLWRLRPGAVRGGAIALVIALASFQFAILSFDALDGWRERFTVMLPTGPSNLLGHGFSIQYAATGVTDPAYAIAPEVLTIVQGKRVAQGRDMVQLGLVVNAYQLHEKHFLYQLYTRFPHILLRELARNWRDQSAYSQLFEMDFVLLNDTHSYRTAEESQAVTARILTNPQDLFHRAFREVHRWTLPSGETILLYERRFAPTEPGITTESYQALIEQFGAEFGAGDALILTAPDQAYIAGMSLPSDTPATVLPLPQDGATPGQTIAALEEAARDHRRLFLLAHNSATSDPDGRIEGWLRAHTVPGPETWLGALQVKSFIPPASPTTTQRVIDATFGETGPLLHAVALDERPLAPGDALLTTLFWEGAEPANLKLSLQLLAPDGSLLAQRDTDLQRGAQGHALLLPRAAAPAAYRLLLTVYDATTLTRLPLAEGTDALELGTVEVRQ